jgi:two-component system chemotaxis response regulator CheY
MKLSGQDCQKLIAFGCFRRAVFVLPPEVYKCPAIDNRSSYEGSRAMSTVSPKILIAEDDKVTLRMLMSWVEKLGGVPIGCADGERAWNLLQDNPDIRLVISDYVMPNMNAHELVCLIRKTYSEEEMPVIVISGIVRLRDITETLELGVDYFLPKPISRREFNEYIERALSPKLESLRNEDESVRKRSRSDIREGVEL